MNTQKAIYKGMLLFLALIISGCAGSSSGKKAASHTYSTSLGTATTFDLNDATTQAFNKFQFQVLRYEESGDRIYVETQWKHRTPFEDEQQAGIVEARTRIIMEARPRIRSGGGTKLHTIQLIGENSVVFAVANTWVNAPLSSMCKDYLKRIADDLKTRFSAGMRRY
jgi:hypothetical protein